MANRDPRGTNHPSGFFDLAAAPRQPLAATTWPTSPRKTRVGVFRQRASGQTSSRRRCRSINTPGSRGCGYKTVSGRHEWRNRDPIGENGGINLYAYVGNDPVNRVDPLGLTFVVSPTPFPGQEGTYGPYVLNIPDGSSLVKPLHQLDPNSLYKNEYKTCQRLQSESPWEALNPGDEAGFDTPYFMGLDADDREYYEYNGEIFADNEINYFGIGMYENWAGDPLAVAIGITDAWKLSQYGQTPNANTFYWLEKGYNDYSGFTDPSQPAPSK